MQMINHKTGDVLELPPPDMSGCSVVRLNGDTLLRVRYSDEPYGVTDLDSGRCFTSPEEFIGFLSSMIFGGSNAAATGN